MLKAKKNIKGFTLLEIIIVLIILAILAAFAIPSYLGYLENTKTTMDKVSLGELNRFTSYYKTSKNISVGDVFTGISTDNARMQLLVNGNYLDSILIPEVKDASFNWDVPSQKWLYNINTGITYNFKTLSVSDFSKKTGTWTNSSDGFYGREGLLFIDNKKSEYTITTRATLGPIEGNVTSAGGYGVLFETILDSTNRDTGYALQFDRGLGGIAIKKRAYGNETSQLLAITNSGLSLIPISKRDAWWTGEREIKIQISNVVGQAGKKQISVFIDNTLIINNFVFDSNVAKANNVTGFRSWTVGTTYGAMQIQ
ncbi:MAG: prepilin-type N-terminal cleavage/methylation domain-containing protein [Clostridia bacterium]